MPFTALFIAHAPDADPQIHRSEIETGLYRLISVIVRDQEQAVAACEDLVVAEGVDSILLCPGNSNADVAGIQAAVGSGVSVSVARGDAPGMRVAAKAMEEVGWFAAQARP
jgi:ABC-type sugar transport system substrate-binding protein